MDCDLNEASPEHAQDATPMLRETSLATISPEYRASVPRMSRVHRAIDSYQHVHVPLPEGKLPACIVSPHSLR
jgi:hypothetical protein